MIRLMFGLKDINFKNENAQFLLASNQVVLQEIKKSFEEAHLGAKNYWNLPASLWNFTNVTTLMAT